MIKPLKIEDLSLLSEIRQKEGQGDIDAIVENYIKSGPSYGIFTDKLISICGLVLLWPGVAECWFLTTLHVEHNKKTFYKDTKEQLYKEVDEHNLHRIQCSINVDNLMSIKWVMKLGFQYEGRLFNYGPDKTDYERFACLY